MVDDDESLRRVVRRMLEQAGYEVEEAPDGAAALEAYRARPPDVVITDVYMPGTDGVEAMIRLRHEFPAPRVIAMSGGGFVQMDEVLDLAKRLGADRTLTKPIVKKALLRAVRDLLSGA